MNKKLFPFAILSLSVVALAFTGSGCRAARNDARIDKLESRVSALEARVEMLQKKP
jgi:outer membrane murein-binding lipoprotein Lpp